MLLPITLNSFIGSKKDNNALLQWSTSSEINSKQFELEKSFDGNTFKKIATVAAAGNSSTTKNYQYIDNALLLENNYYRLKSVDLDNRSSISNTVLIKNSAVTQGIVIEGNPFTNNISLRFFKKPGANGILKLQDAAGRLVATQKIVPGDQQLIFVLPAQLVKAVYYLKAEIDGKTYIATTIKR